METLTEEQLIFLATHTKRLRHCFNLASQHDDDADAAVIDLQHNAFADMVESGINVNPAEEPTPQKQRSLHLSQTTSGTNGVAQNLQKAARKLYKAFCRECYAHFTPPVLEEEPLSQSQITYLLPATLFSMYLENASPAELRLLKVLRKHNTCTVVGDDSEKPKKHNAEVDAEEVIKEKVVREVDQVIAHTVKEAVDSKQRECDIVIHALKMKIVELEATAATLQEREEKATREKGQLELKFQRVSDELSAVSRRYQFLLNKQNEDKKETSEKPRGGGLGEKEITSRTYQQSQQDQQQKQKASVTAAISPPPPQAFGEEDDEDDLLIPSCLQSANLGNAPPITKNEVAKTSKKKLIVDKDDDNAAADDDDDDVTLLSASKGGKKKKGACAKCGKASGERFQCQRCKLRFHEICGGPYAPEETDLAPELMDRIVDSENEAVIKFLTEDSGDHFNGLEDFTTSQLDFEQIDEMRNRRLCQLYCRVCRREQGIISDGSSSAEESEDNDDSDNDDDDGWSTDSSVVREREEKAALDVSRFPPTQYDDCGASDKDGEPDVISISSETSSQLRRKRRAEKKKKKEEKREEKQKRKESRKKLGKRKIKSGKRSSGDGDDSNSEERSSEDSFIVGGGSSMDDDDSDDDLLSRRSKFVLMEAREAESDTDDENEDEDHEGGGEDEDAGIVPEEGLQRHKKETANRLIKANHKRKRERERGKGEGSTRNNKNSRADGGEEDEEDPIENSSDEEVQSSGKKKNNTAIKRKPVLDQNDLDVLDILGLEAPSGTKIEKSNSTKLGGKVRKPVESSSSSACSSDDEDENNGNIDDTIGDGSNPLFGIVRGIEQFAISPSGTTRDDAVQISQSTAGGGVSPSRDVQSANHQQQESGEGRERRGRGVGRNHRSHEIFETLRHGNQSQATGLQGPGIAVNRALGFAAPRQRQQGTAVNAANNNSAETAMLLPHADEEDAFWGNDSTMARTAGAGSTNSNRLLFSTSRNQNNVGNKKGSKRTF